MTIRCGVCTTNEMTLVKTCTYSDVNVRLFYPNCPKLNTLCSAKRCTRNYRLPTEVIYIIWR